ncbi:MAG: aryl-sulfate sulfotransferase [Pseudomonadota bacterium]|nr:aryl-sulfate sulfotransferase [Pseudomonadota bacterium]
MIALLLAACAGPGADDTGTSTITAEVVPSANISTLATLVWSSPEAFAGVVRYGTDERTFDVPFDASATTHETLLLGVPAGTEVTWTVLDDAGAPQGTGTYTTGALPTELPSLTIAGGGHDQFMLTPLIGATTAAVILSPEGHIVWYHLDDRGLDVYRVRLASDGSGIVYNAASVSGDPAEDSALVHVAWDGVASTELAVPLLSHDFVELADGTLAAIGVKYGPGADGADVRGDRIVEIAPDGTQTDIWTSWDCFDPTVYEGDDIELGWTFANALDYVAETDSYRLGLRNFSSIVEVDRSGACGDVIGGDPSDYTFEGSRFRHQHQFHVYGDRLLVFDNDGAGGNASRAIEYALDPVAKTATQVWDYTPDPKVYSFVLGDAARLDDGDTFVAFSVAGQLDRVSPDGVVEWSVNTDVGYAFGFVTLVPALVP